MFNFFALALLPDGVGPCSLENAQQKSEIDGDTVFTQKCDTLLNALLATDKMLDCETVKHPKGLKSFQEKKWSGQLEENGCVGDFRKSIVGFSAPPTPSRAWPSACFLPSSLSRLLIACAHTPHICFPVFDKHRLLFARFEEEQHFTPKRSRFDAKKVADEQASMF